VVDAKWVPPQNANLWKKYAKCEKRSARNRTTSERNLL